MRNEEFAKKFGIPEEESFFCGVGGLKEMSGTAGWDTDKSEAVGKLGLEGLGTKENGSVGIGSSLVDAGGATSTEEGVSRANVKSFGGSKSGFTSDLCTS